MDEPEALGRGAKKMAVVRDDEHGAFKRRERHRQRLARFHVEVVGRFVEHEEVGLRPRDEGERETRLFSPPPTWAPGGAREVAGEPVDAEVVAQFLLSRTSGASRFMCSSGDSSARELIELMLREVADLQTLAAAQFPANFGISPRPS